MAAQYVEVKLELGHQASLRSKQTTDGYTHDWTIFVRGPEGCNIQHFVEKVIFHLHETFPKPKRVVKEPPYEVTECGYAGFNMTIEVCFKNKEEPKRVSFDYDLYLHAEGPPIINCRCEKLTFQNPTEEFRKKLMRGGAVALSGSAHQSAAVSASGGDSHHVRTETELLPQGSTPSRPTSSAKHPPPPFSTTPTLPANQRISNQVPKKAPKSSSGNSGARSANKAPSSSQHHNTKEAPRLPEPKPPPVPRTASQPFTDIFGPPIKKSETVNKTKDREKSKPSKLLSSTLVPEKALPGLSPVPPPVVKSTPKDSKSSSHKKISKESSKKKEDSSEHKENTKESAKPSKHRAQSPHSVTSDNVSNNKSTPKKNRKRSVSVSSTASSIKSEDKKPPKKEEHKSRPPKPPKDVPNNSEKLKSDKTMHKPTATKKEPEPVVPASTNGAIVDKKPVKTNSEPRKRGRPPGKDSKRNAVNNDKVKENIKEVKETKEYVKEHVKEYVKDVKAERKPEVKPKSEHKVKERPVVKEEPKPETPEQTSEAMEDVVVEEEDEEECSAASSSSGSPQPAANPTNRPLATMMAEMEEQEGLLSPLSSDPSSSRSPSPPNPSKKIRTDSPVNDKKKSYNNHASPAKYSEAEHFTEEKTPKPLEPEKKKPVAVELERKRLNESSPECVKPSKAKTEDKPPSKKPRSEKINKKKELKTPERSGHMTNGLVDPPSPAQGGSPGATPLYPNGIDETYLQELRSLQERIMAIRDHQHLQKIVDLIEETGLYQVTGATFDFDLCALDRSTVQRLHTCLSVT